jgi:quercetin dioxygenase-like cupin family protein
MVHPGVLSNWLEDDRMWVPQTATVSFKPCLLSASNGYFVNILRVRQKGVLSRHRHAGAVHALVLRGCWHYLEHDWAAEEGSYIFEAPGETHTLIVPDGVDEMMTWFHNTGVTRTSIRREFQSAMRTCSQRLVAKRHYKAIGLGEDYVNRFIR